MSQKSIEQVIKELSLAEDNLKILIEKGWDTQADHEEVHWLRLELDRLSRKDRRGQ